MKPVPTASSLDGSIATTDHLDWLFALETSTTQLPGFRQGHRALVWASTYEWMLSAVGSLPHIPNLALTQPTWVFSHRPQPIVSSATSVS